MDAKLSIAGLSLPVALVAQLIEAHLNEYELKRPHRVVRFDLADLGDPESLVHVDLEPVAASERAGEAAPGVDIEQAAAELKTVMVERAQGHNGNGHGAAAVQVATIERLDAAQNGGPDGASEDDKRRRGRATAEKRAEVLRRRADGEKVAEIAKATGLSEGTCYEILAEHRRFQKSLGVAEGVGGDVQAAGG